MLSFTYIIILVNYHNRTSHHLIFITKSRTFPILTKKKIKLLQYMHYMHIILGNLVYSKPIVIHNNGNLADCDKKGDYQKSQRVCL